MIIKEMVKKLMWGKRYDSKSYIKYLRSIGVKIGQDCIIYVPTKTIIDEQYPWMISIGDHVRITEGVKILTHDYSWSVIKVLNGEICGAAGKVCIGNNVFIGMNSIVTRNVSIGNNVIIGAGSVVTRDCEDNSVYAGVPAKKIMSLDEYIEKRINAQTSEAKMLAEEYKNRFGSIPSPEIFHEFFMLFSDINNIEKNEVFNEKMKQGGNYQTSMDYSRKNKAKFDTYEDFISYCFPEED